MNQLRYRQAVAFLFIKSVSLFQLPNLFLQISLIQITTKN